MARFTVYFDNREIKSYELTDAAITIGRLPENSISIPNMGISRRHARLEIDSNHKYVLADLNSLNGTYLNNKKVKQAQLKTGDKISIGKYTILYEEPAENAPKSNEVAAAPAGGGKTPVEPRPSTASEPPAETPGEAVLIETNKHMVYKLDKPVITIGSEESDDIFVSGFMIGGQHALIERSGTEVWIKSNKFVAKFKVNGKKSNNHQLHHKDRIEIGSSTFRYMENE